MVDALLDAYLQGLGDAGRKGPADLQPGENGHRYIGLIAQGPPQEVSGRHGILDSQVNADASYGRHRMGSISDTDQAFPVPGVEMVYFNA